MNPIKFVRPNITLSFWFALSAALIAFAIISDQLLFALGITSGAILIRSISQKSSKVFHYTLRFTFTFTAYLTALLPLWPETISDYYYAPLLLSLGVALIAALNQHSYGGSRGVTAIAAIAFLLFIRNIVLYFHFEAPLAELSFSLGFIAFMEIALSNRYHDSDDNPHPELVFGLVLALIASFHFTSLLLGFVLASVPLLAFLLRNHEMAKIANEHTRAARSLTPTPRPSTKHSLLTISLIPALLTGILYLITLRLPFWADYLPNDAPYIAQSIAHKAKTISEAADLEDETVQNVANALVDQKFLKEKATQLANAWAQDTTNLDAPRNLDRKSVV